MLTIGRRDEGLRLALPVTFLARKEPIPMSAESSMDAQQKIKEFLALLPLTSAIAGLPHSEPGKHFNEGQMDARVMTIRTAYKLAPDVGRDQQIGHGAGRPLQWDG